MITKDLAFFFSILYFSQTEHPDNRLFMNAVPFAISTSCLGRCILNLSPAKIKSCPIKQGKLPKFSETIVIFATHTARLD